MPKLPTATDVTKARQQASAAIEQARTPLYAVLGAGELASEAVRDYVNKARAEAGGGARDMQTRANDLQARLAELQERLTEVRSQVRTRVGELPEEFAGLRGRLESGELRHALESYVQSLQELYERLATRGEATAARLRQQPQVKRAMDRVEEAADLTEARVGKIVEDARQLTYDVLGRAGRRTRSTGEKAAIRVERAAGEVAEAVEEAGDELASTTRSVSRKAANRARPAATRQPASRKRTTGS